MPLHTLYIESLTIQNLRNIINAELAPGKKLNFLIGPNGAGKTTLLESIYLLARARSFRPSQNRNLINKQNQQLIIFSRLKRDSGSICQIGLKKEKSKTLIKRDGTQVSRLSELAHTLPLTVITPNIQRIIEEGPKQRRKLLNWGLFHVEQSYGHLVMRYAKTLSQRNRALPGREDDLKIWTHQLATIGEEISVKQAEYLEVWNQATHDLLMSSGFELPFKMALLPGWRSGTSLEEALNEHYKIDRERGFTSSGPHRMDIKIMAHGQDIKHDYSRGQKKIVSMLMMLGQASLQRMKTLESPIVLVDDLHSELDKVSSRSMISLITQLDIQSFITSLDIHDMTSDLNGIGGEVFHVEHGTVTGPGP